MRPRLTHKYRWIETVSFARKIRPRTDQFYDGFGTLGWHGFRLREFMIERI